MIAQALCFVVAAWVMLRWRKPEPLPGTSTPVATLGWGIGAAFAAFALSSAIAVTLNLLGLEIKEHVIDEARTSSAPRKM